MNERKSLLREEQQRQSGFSRSNIMLETKSVQVNSVRLSSQVVCAGLDNGMVQVWNTSHSTPPKLLFHVRHSPLPVRGVDVMLHDYSSRREEQRQNVIAVSCGDDYQIKLWDLRENNDTIHNHTHTPVACVVGHYGIVRSVQLYPGQEERDMTSRHIKFVSASDDKTVRLWNWKYLGGKVQCLRVFVGHTAPVTCATFAPPTLQHSQHSTNVNGSTTSRTGLLVASSSLDGTVAVWDAMLGVMKFRLEGHHGPVQSVAFHSDGLPILVSTGGRSDVNIWRLTETKAWQVDAVNHSSKIGRHTETIVTGCHLFDNHFVSFGGEDDATLRIWSLSQRKLCRSIRFFFKDTTTNNQNDDGGGEGDSKYKQQTCTDSVQQQPLLNCTRDKSAAAGQLRLTCMAKDPNYSSSDSQQNLYAVGHNHGFCVFLEDESKTDTDEPNKEGALVVPSEQTITLSIGGAKNMNSEVLVVDQSYDVRGMETTRRRMYHLNKSLAKRRALANGLKIVLYSCLFVLCTCLFVLLFVDQDSNVWLVPCILVLVCLAYHQCQRQKLRPWRESIFDRFVRQTLEQHALPHQQQQEEDGDALELV